MARMEAPDVYAERLMKVYLQFQDVVQVAFKMNPSFVSALDKVIFSLALSFSTHALSYTRALSASLVLFLRLSLSLRLSFYLVRVLSLPASPVDIFFSGFSCSRK